MSGIGNNILIITRRAAFICRLLRLTVTSIIYLFTAIAAELWFLAPELCSGHGVSIINMIAGNALADIRMQQATVNLFADMGVQPGSLQTNLVAATASADHQAPSSVITNPSDGGSIPSGSPITITGTASDAGGGVVAGIEISVDGGATWHVANGTSNWSYSWTPPTEGTVIIKSRATDDNVNLETPGTAPAANAITVNVTSSQATCPCTIFQPSDVPDIAVANDNTAEVGIENGVKFKSSENGFITGIRFYKGAGNTGTHTGQLWSLTGTLLAQAIFVNESASGWQEVLFDNPVAITAGTVYVAAYHSSEGYYAYTDAYFTAEKVNGPLHAIANSDADGPNGVYLYTTNPSFPTNSYQSSNYWVDVVFTETIGPDNTPPAVISTVPAANAQNVNINAVVTATFSEAIKPSTVNNTTVKLTKTGTTKAIAATVTYDAGTHSATLTPSSLLKYSTSYTVTIAGGTTGKVIKDNAGNALATNYTWTFTTSDPPSPLAAEGPGGPILLISSSSNPFSRYPVEMLKAQGLNEYKAIDIAEIKQKVLNKYDVVIVGNINLSAAQVTLLTDWTNAGGTLIALRPDKKLAGLLGLTAATGSLSNGYILVNTATPPGSGIVNQAIQYHGTADLYTLNGASGIATLYSNANTPTAYPAVTTNNVGTNGGKAIAFTYDLARSIVYTRQGNPDWAGQKRDGQIDPIRSDDLFFPDWVDFNKIAIPQADEQMHLLTNIILLDNLHKKPLPKFWFLPRGLEAVVVMTGDDHGNGGTIGRFNQYKTLGPNDPASVANWTAIRGTSYVYPGTPITNAQATAFQSDGFEIALHTSTGCQNFTPASLENDYATQLAQFASQFPGLNAPVTNRTHCIAWSDWASEPKTEAAQGIRLDANYYYWPASWVQDRPGMFTGSGMPMRFADVDGSLIDCYQLTTQMTDESGITYSDFINQFLDKAQGSEGYYGVFCANMHTDNASSDGSDAIIASAQAHQVPVISAKQMLDWLDGRNNSSFGSITWNGNTLNFTITAANGSNNMQAMLPMNSQTSRLQSVSLNGGAVTFNTQIIKGVEYAFFNATTGNYTAVYATGIVQPVAKTSLIEKPDMAETSKNNGLYLKASPNPSANEFTLVAQSKNSLPYQIRIINMLGVNVFQANGSGNKIFRFGKNFNSGVYIIHAIQANQIQTLKIIKGD